MPVLTGSVHAHILTKPSRAGFALSSLELIESGVATCVYRHVATPGSINSKRITAKPAREGFVSMRACAEPVRTGIGAVCVEYG